MVGSVSPITLASVEWTSPWIFARFSYSTIAGRWWRFYRTADGSEFPFYGPMILRDGTVASGAYANRSSAPTPSPGISCALVSDLVAKYLSPSSPLGELWKE